jgi:hypothetical protein
VADGGACSSTPPISASGCCGPRTPGSRAPSSPAPPASAPGRWPGGGGWRRRPGRRPRGRARGAPPRPPPRSTRRCGRRSRRARTPPWPSTAGGKPSPGSASARRRCRGCWPSWAPRSKKDADRPRARRGRADRVPGRRRRARPGWARRPRRDEHADHADPAARPGAARRAGGRAGAAGPARARGPDRRPDAGRHRRPGPAAGGAGPARLRRLGGPGAGAGPAAGADGAAGQPLRPPERAGAGAGGGGGCRLLPLPRYSPDLNPIEPAFAKV